MHCISFNTEIVHDVTLIKFLLKPISKIISYISTCIFYVQTIDHIPPEMSSKTENEDLLKQLRAEMRKLTDVTTFNKEI